MLSLGHRIHGSWEKSKTLYPGGEGQNYLQTSKSPTDGGGTESLNCPPSKTQHLPKTETEAEQQRLPPDPHSIPTTG